MRRLTMACLLWALACTLNAQQTFINPSYTYIFRLDSQQLNLAINRGVFDTPFFFTHRVDSYYYSIPPLGYGYWLLAKADGLNITYYLESRPFAEVNALAFNGKVQLRMYDSSQNTMNDARLWIAGEQVPYDTVCSCFSVKSTLRCRRLYFERDSNYMITAITGSSINTDAHRVPGSDAERPVISHGYFIVNQPQYLPGDSVRLKAYLLKPGTRPFRRKLNLVMYDGARYYSQLATIKPQTPGAYVYTFRLGDSLRIDQDYTLALRTRSGRRLSETRFRIEDYKLRNNTYTARIEKARVYRGEKVRFYAKAVDANGLPLLGASIRLNLSLLSYRNFTGKWLFVPDAWKEEMYTTTVSTDISSETIIDLPDSIFPAMDMEFKAQLLFTDASGELTVRDIYFNVLNKSSYYSFSREFNKISALYIDSGISRPSRVVLRSIDFRYHIKIDTLAVPFTLLADPGMMQYDLMDTLGTPVSSVNLGADPWQELAFTGERTRDSIRIDLYNPYRFKVNFELYKGGVIVKRGSATEFSYHVCDTSFDSYNLLYSFNNRATEHLDEAVFTFKDRSLKVETNLPATVFPGQTIAVDLKVTGANRKPVKKANLTAYAVNSRFENLRQPSLRYYGSPGFTMLNRQYVGVGIQSQEWRINGSFRANWNTLLLAGLKYMADFRLRFPEDSMFVNIDTTGRPGVELVPFVVANGRSETIYATWIDSIPVQVNTGDRIRQVLIVKPGVHQLKLRTRNAMYTLNVLNFKDSSRYVISFDTMCVSGTIRKTVATDHFGFSQSELLDIRRHILQFEDRGLFDGTGIAQWEQHGMVIHSGQILFRYTGSNSRLLTQSFYGPFAFDTVHFYMNGTDSLKINFAPGYRYTWFNNKMVADALDSFYTPFDFRFFKSYNAEFEEVYGRPQRIYVPEKVNEEYKPELPEPTAPSFDEDCLGGYYFTDDANPHAKTGRLHVFGLDITHARSYFFLHTTRDHSSFLSSAASSQYLMQLVTDTGFYNIVITNKRNKVAVFRNRFIAPSGITLFRIDTLDFVKPCTMLTEFIPLLKKLSDEQKMRTNRITTYKVNDYVHKRKAPAIRQTPVAEKRSALSGFVYDNNGNVLQDVIITLEQAGVIKAISFSDGTGGFVMRALNEGNYQLRFTRYGSCITILNDMRLKARSTAEIHVRLLECGFSSVDGYTQPAIYEAVSYDQSSDQDDPSQKGLGILRGKVVDADTKQSLDFVAITLSNKGVVASVLTDDNGEFVIKGLKEGEYELKGSIVGYHNAFVQKISIEPDVVRYVNFAMQPVSVTGLHEVVVVSDMPVRDQDEKNISEYRKAPLSSMGILNNSLGVESRSGGAPNIRGARADGTAYYIDGIRVQNGPTYTPRFAPGKVNKATGGVPARIGDTGLSSLYKIMENPEAGQTRKTFRDYAYWEPNLVTDKRGMAHFSITFPGNITQWRNYIVAMNRKLNTAVVVTDIRSYKPLMASLYLPRFAISGDSIRLMGKVVNHTGQPIAIKTSFAERDSVKLTRSCEVNQFVEQDLWVQPKSADTMGYTYQLETTFGYKDGEKYLLPVLPNGVMLNQFRYYSLPGDTAISFVTDSTALTHLVVMDNYTQLIREEINRLKQYQYGCAEQTASKLKALLTEKRLNRLLGDTFTGDEMVKACIRRLNNMQSSAGGWGWFAGSVNENWLTFYITETLFDAERMGYHASALAKALRLLETMFPQFSSADKITALSLLYDAKVNLQYFEELGGINENGLDFFDRVQLTLLKQKLQLSHFAGFILSGMRKDNYGGIYWENANGSIYRNRTSVTLLAYQVLRNDGFDSTMLAGIVKHFFNEEAFNSGYYRNTLESAQVLQVMSTDIARAEMGTLKASITLNGDPIRQMLPLNLPLEPHTKYTMSKTGAYARMFVYNRRFEEHPATKADHFVVTSTLVQNNKITDSIHTRMPLSLAIKLDVKAPSEFLMMEIPIPAGCDYAGKERSYGEDYAEYYKDHVTLFFRRMREGTYHFSFPLEPRFEGRFTLLPVRVSNMYDVEISGNNASRKVIITP